MQPAPARESEPPPAIQAPGSDIADHSMSPNVPGSARHTGGATKGKASSKKPKDSPVASRWRRAAGRGILHRRGLKSGDVSRTSTVALLLQGRQLRRKKKQRDLLQLAVAAMGGKMDWGELM